MNAMEFSKYVIKGKYHSQTIYHPKSEVVDDKNCVLLGFKDTIPVLSRKMNKVKNAAGVKKTLKIEVDSKTGEKYINLNGKKIKIIPESELPAQLPKNAQVRKIASLNSIPAGACVKLKVVREVPVKNSNFSITRYTSKDNHTSNAKGNQTILSEIPKLHILSQKTLIKESEFNVNSLSGNMTIKANTTDNKPHQNTEMFKSERNPVVSINKTGSRDKFNENARALDLTNYSVKLIKPENIDNFTQTVEKKLVDAWMQTDDFNVFNYDLDDIMRDLSPLLQPTPRSSETFDNFDPGTDLLDLNRPCNPKSESSLNHHSEANNFFTELRMALQPDEKGNMRIHMAVLQNSLNMVKRSWFILKTLNQSVDLPNSNDYTPLQLAIIHDASKDVIQFLVSKHANLDITDSDGNNLIHLTIEHRRVDALPILLDHAFSARFNLDQYNHEGSTPLIMCCLNGLHECAKLLLDFDADINARDLISGRTALFHAAECHDVDMVELLLQYQADTKIKNFFGTSPHDAMYEIEDIPEQIKSMILGKNNKRKAVEEPRPPKVKKEDFRRKNPSLKTYARLQKIGPSEMAKKLLTPVK